MSSLSRSMKLVNARRRLQIHVTTSIVRLGIELMKHEDSIAARKADD